MFQILLKGLNPPNCLGLRYGFFCLWSPALLLTALCVSNSTWRFCCTGRFLNGATGHRSYLFQWPPEQSCLKRKDQTLRLGTALRHWKVPGSANRISKCCNLLPLWSSYKRKLTRKTQCCKITFLVSSSCWNMDLQITKIIPTLITAACCNIS